MVCAIHASFLLAGWFCVCIALSGIFFAQATLRGGLLFRWVQIKQLLLL
jgi:hypothetical protein